MNSFGFIFCLMFSICIGMILADCDNLQDACPTAPGNQSVFINGFPCKNPTEINAQDFKSSKLDHAGDTDNFLRSSVSIVTAAEFPGLNTLGLSIARTDLDIDGIVAPHSHPRSSEILFVYKGVVSAGFIDTQNQIFQTFLNEGDVFVFPRGLLHFCLNAGFEPATAFSVHNSQNPGAVSISDAKFGIDQEGIKNIAKRLISGSASEIHRAANTSMSGAVVLDDL